MLYDLPDRVARECATLYWTEDGGTALMSRLQVLIAVEYRVHREALAGMLRALRPGIEVYEAEPGHLDDLVVEQGPDVVISSRSSEVVEARAFGWAILYPGGKNHSVLSLAGDRSHHVSIRIDELLTFVDTANMQLHP